MVKYILTAITALFIGLSATAKEPRTVLIHLTDNTQVKGQIVEMVNGAYKVKTKTLGELTIKADDIARIDYKAETVAKADDTYTPPSVSQGLSTADRTNALFGFEEILQSMLGDPETMKDIQQLAEDPEFMAVINDPEITKAIESGNFMALAKNRKIWGLMDHPKVKELSRQMEGGEATDSQPETPAKPEQTPESEPQTAN